MFICHDFWIAKLKSSMRKRRLRTRTRISTNKKLKTNDIPKLASSREIKAVMAVWRSKSTETEREMMVKTGCLC